MPTLGYFDRERIQNDLVQIGELLDRNQYLRDQTSDPAKQQAIDEELERLLDQQQQLNAILNESN